MTDKELLAKSALIRFKKDADRLNAEAFRRYSVLIYLEKKQDLTYDDICCAESWISHSTKTADEIIRILEEDE